MKYTLTILLIILIGFTSHAQTPGSWRITNNFNYLDAFDLERDNYGNTFIVGGFPTSGMGFSINDGMYCQVDSTGYLVWGVAVNASDDCGLSDLALTPDGGFVATGNLHIGPTQDAALVVKVDYSGVIQWARKIYDPGGGSIWSADKIIVLNNGNCVVFSTYSSFQGWGREISCFDPNGTRIWSKLIDADPGYYTAIPSYDGGFFALGFNFELTRFDSMGTILSSKIMSISGPVFVDPVGIHRTSNQKFLVSGQFHNGLYPTEDIGIAQLDSTGNVEWCRAYIKDGRDFTMDVMEESSGYTIAGYGYYSSNIKDTAYVIRVNEGGDVRWARKKNDALRIHKAIRTAPGKYMMGGHTEPVSGTPAYLVCADSTELFYGACFSDLTVHDTTYSVTTLTQTLYEITDVTIVDPEVLTTSHPLQIIADCNVVGLKELENNGYFSVSPNPSSGNFTIHNPLGLNGRIEIFNVVGDKLYESAIEGHEKNIQTALTSGIYFLVLSDQQNNFKQKLIVK